LFKGTPRAVPDMVRVNEFVRQVLVGGIFTHLNVGSSDYSRVIGARLRLHTEKLWNNIQWGLIPTKASQKWTKTET
jgi:hypothetical protein